MVIRIYSRCPIHRTWSTTIARWISWRIATSSFSWCLWCSVDPTYTRSCSASNREWIVGRECKILRTCLLITLTTVEVSWWRSNSLASKSITRTWTKWWPGTKRLIQTTSEVGCKDSSWFRPLTHSKSIAKNNANLPYLTTALSKSQSIKFS